MPTTPQFNRYCNVRFGLAVRSMPLETAAKAPMAHVDPAVYMPPRAQVTLTQSHAHFRHSKFRTFLSVVSQHSAPACTHVCPAHRPGAAGWYPEYGKAWESWNAPNHT